MGGDLGGHLGVPRDALPAIRSHTAALTLRPDLARTLGLEGDCVVAVGGVDGLCATWAWRALRPEIVSLSAGTSAAVRRLADRRVSTPRRAC